MAKVQRSDVGKKPPRSESFLRMLELEKQYKMQRIQDNSPATASLPSTSSAPVQPSSAPRARRASGYPPLSHQDQIMKAMNRNSTLPSLSISIPPSPEQDPPSRTSETREEPPPVKEERTKTVTFSDPEEDESYTSDQSSICHSPSWEGWSKKTKRPSKSEPREVRTDKGDKLEKTPRKKGNKLSKAPPPSPLAISAAQSQSALEAGPHHKTDKATIEASQPNQQEEMARGNAQPTLEQPVVLSEGKPKSRSFLSGFKLQHGNVTGVKKLLEGHSERDVQVSQPGRARKPSGTPMKKSHSDGVILDMRSGSRDPSADPSIRSYSSLEKRPPMVRPPSSSSNHGRSQSLLSSTLNKLRGPSYLYHRPQEAKSGRSSLRPPSRDNDAPQPSEGSESRPGSSGGPPLVISKPPLSRRFRHKSTTSDTTVPTAMSSTSRSLPLRDVNASLDLPEPQPASRRHSDIPTIETSDHDSMVQDVQLVSKSHATRDSRGTSTERHPDYRNDKAPVRAAEHELRHKSRRQAKSRVEKPVESLSDSEQSVSSSQDEDYASAHEQQVEHVSATHRRRGGGDASQGGTNNAVPAIIRTPSRERDDSPSTPKCINEPFPVSPSPNTIGQAVTSKLDVEPKPDQGNRPSKTDKAESQNEGKLRVPTQQLRPKMSSDYFTFINESYAPPSLELRSPLENLLDTLSKPEALEKIQAGDTYSIRSSSRQMFESEKATAEGTETPRVRGESSNRLATKHKSQDSLALPSRSPERDAPSFERSSASTKTAKASGGSDAGSTSTRQSQQHETSLSASERSSSSTFGDAPPSPSSMTTPESSRPHSHKSRPPSHLDLSRGEAVAPPHSGHEEKPMVRAFPLSKERSPQTSRPTSKETVSQDDTWSRSALPLDLENYSSVSLGGAGGAASTPALISTPTSMTFVDALKEEIAEDANSKKESLPPRAHSALDLPSTNFLPPLKHQALNHKKNSSKLSATITNTPSPPVPEAVEEPLRPALKKTRHSSGNSQDSHVVVSTGAAYLEEARKTVTGAPVPSGRALRPQFPHRNTTIGTKGASSSRAEPMAKMLVECCNCHFFHDMPARVYECMAKPDSVIEDKTLGVSAAITTMVKCPWCSHGMTTQCCSGYAAVVYLKEKLHGK